MIPTKEEMKQAVEMYIRAGMLDMTYDPDGKVRYKTRAHHLVDWARARRVLAEEGMPEEFIEHVSRGDKG